MKRLLLNLARAVGVVLFCAACFFLPPVVKGIFVLGFSAAAFIHFCGRIFRHRRNGNARASAVSLALVFLSLGPIVVVGITRGYLEPSTFPVVEFLAVLLSILLVFAILRVEAQDAQRKALKASQEEAREAIRLMREQG